MPDYKTMYYQLAGRVADAIDLLTAAMQQGELAYLQSVEMPDENLPFTNDDSADVEDAEDR